MHGVPVYKNVVLKLTGHLFDPQRLEANLRRFSITLREAQDGGLFERLVVVAGGGELARSLIKVGRTLGLDETSLDGIGIGVARLHAALFAGALAPLACPTVPSDLDEMVDKLRHYPIVVLGGLHPGHSTSAVAALAAERIRSDLLLIATDVEGVFSRDPKIDRKAKFLETVTVPQLYRLLMGAGSKAGTYELLDLVALKIISRSKIPTRITKCDPSIITNVLKGLSQGTLITHR